MGGEDGPLLCLGAAVFPGMCGLLWALGAGWTVDVSQPVPVGFTLCLSSSQVCPFAELWAVKQGPFVCYCHQSPHLAAPPLVIRRPPPHRFSLPALCTWPGRGLMEHALSRSPPRFAQQPFLLPVPMAPCHIFFLKLPLSPCPWMVWGASFPSAPGAPPHSGLACVVPQPEAQPTFS